MNFEKIREYRNNNQLYLALQEELQDVNNLLAKEYLERKAKAEHDPKIHEQILDQVREFEKRMGRIFELSSRESDLSFILGEMMQQDSLLGEVVHLQWTEETGGLMRKKKQELREKFFLICPSLEWRDIRGKGVEEKEHFPHFQASVRSQIEVVQNWHEANIPSWNKSLEEYGYFAAPATFEKRPIRIGVQHLTGALVQEAQKGIENYIQEVLKNN